MYDWNTLASYCYYLSQMYLVCDLNNDKNKSVGLWFLRAIELHK